MKDYQLTQGNIGHFISEVTRMLREPGKWRVNIVKWREKRSLSQNNMYWMWLAEIDKQKPLKCDTGEFTGSELWHEVFKKYYCSVKQITDGDNYMAIKSTKLLDVGEMTYYLNQIETWCIDRGLTLTIPEDSEYYGLMRGQNA